MAWWSGTDAAWIGGIGGSIIGIFGAFIGIAAARWVPAGRHKGVILGAMTLLTGVGVVLLIAGIAAVSTGQPYHVWYPLVLGGFIMAVVIGCLLPVVRLRYRQAEQRRLGAEEFRRS